MDLTADLSAFTGDVLLGFRYWTDVAAVEPGFMVDNIMITGYPVDGAEVDAGWTFDGFSVTTGTESAFYNNYYVAEYRQYRGYDRGLANAYNFGWGGVPGLGNLCRALPLPGRPAGQLLGYILPEQQRRRKLCRWALRWSAAAGGCASRADDVPT